jgi:hypothetical protein
MKALVNIGFLMMLAGVVLAVSGGPFGGGLLLFGFTASVVGRMGEK